jgi:hypothetical protein
MRILQDAVNAELADMLRSGEPVPPPIRKLLASALGRIDPKSLSKKQRKKLLKLAKMVVGELGEIEVSMRPEMVN